MIIDLLHRNLNEKYKQITEADEKERQPLCTNAGA